MEAEEAEVVVRRVLSCTDNYSTLEISRQASSADIRRAYLHLSRRVHPDRNPHPSADEAFRRVSAANACLSDERRRQIYDLTGRDHDTPAASPFSGPFGAARGGGTSYFYFGGSPVHSGAPNARNFRQDFANGAAEPDLNFLFNAFFNGAGGAPRRRAAPQSGRDGQQPQQQQGHPRGARAGAPPPPLSPGDALRQLLYMIGVVAAVVVLFSLLTVDWGSVQFELSPSPSFPLRRTTSRFMVDYWIRSGSDAKLRDAALRARLEDRVERAHIQALRRECEEEERLLRAGVEVVPRHCDLLRARLRSAAA